MKTLNCQPVNNYKHNKNYLSTYIALKQGLNFFKYTKYEKQQ